MYNFALKKIDVINGGRIFHKLEINGKCEYDDFECEIEKDGNLRREITKIYSNMEDIANGLRLPPAKFKELKRPKNDVYKEFEIKTKHLRVYFFIDVDSNKIIVLGGKKVTQPNDIARFRSIKNAYLKK